MMQWRQEFRLDGVKVSIAGLSRATSYFPLTRRVLYSRARNLLAAAVNSTVVAGENLTVGSTVWLPAESVAPGR
jgi:hypothetical protein